MPHLPFTLAQLDTVQAFPTPHRLTLHSRNALDPDIVEDIAGLGRLTEMIGLTA